MKAIETEWDGERKVIPFHSLLPTAICILFLPSVNSATQTTILSF